MLSRRITKLLTPFCQWLSVEVFIAVSTRRLFRKDAGVRNLIWAPVSPAPGTSAKREPSNTATQHRYTPARKQLPLSSAKRAGMKPDKRHNCTKQQGYFVFQRQQSEGTDEQQPQSTTGFKTMATWSHLSSGNKRRKNIAPSNVSAIVRVSVNFRSISHVVSPHNFTVHVLLPMACR
jgi:hypothetical protein